MERKAKAELARAAVQGRLTPLNPRRLSHAQAE